MNKAEQKIIDEARSKMDFPVPVFGDDWHSSKIWMDCTADYTTCYCGAYPDKMRGWFQVDTPCRIIEYQCKHGHQWTGQTNCD